MAAAYPDVSDPRERERLKLLYRLELFETDPEDSFDTLTALAAELCGRPTSLVSLVGEHRQFFKSRHGTDLIETPRSSSFCSRAIESSVDVDEIFEVPDTHLDGRFRTNPLVIGAPHIRHYAGVPLRPTGDLAVGTLCVIGPESGRLDERQRRDLARLGALAEQLLRLRLIARMEADAHSRAEEQERYYRYLAENTADLVIVHDEDLAISYMSPNVNEFLGFEPGETWGLPHGRRILSAADRERLLAAVRNLKEAAPTATTRLDVILNDGTTRTCEVITRAIFEAGRIKEFQSSTRDISHVVSYERKLEASNLELAKMVEERPTLIRGIAHDLAAPLAAIRVTAESLTSQVPDGPVLEQLRRLEDFAQSAEAFASDLRSIANPEMVGDALAPKSVPVRPVVERAIAQVASPPGRDLSLKLDDVEAFLDPHALSRITTNLVINANRHTPPGTPIEVSLLQRGQHVLLVVADRGPGIPSEFREIVLEPYVTTTTTGSGLGLAISKNLAEGLGGQLIIEDNEPMGTVVTVRFPVTSSTLVG